MSNNNIICRIFDEPKIRIKIFDTPKIVCKFGSQGLKGDGTTDHSQLSNLDYVHSGHSDFQKKLTYVSEYKAYLVE